MLFQFSRSKNISFESVEDFVRNTIGEDAKICNPEMLRKRLEKAKGGEK